MHFRAVTHIGSPDEFCLLFWPLDKHFSYNSWLQSPNLVSWLFGKRLPSRICPDLNARCQNKNGDGLAGGYVKLGSSRRTVLHLKEICDDIGSWSGDSSPSGPERLTSNTKCFGGSRFGARRARPRNRDRYANHGSQCTRKDCATKHGSHDAKEY